MAADKNWNALKVPELKGELTSRGLPTTGNKADLVARLQAYEKQKADEATAVAPVPAAATANATATAEDEIDWEDDAESRAAEVSEPADTAPATETKQPIEADGPEVTVAIIAEPTTEPVAVDTTTNVVDKPAEEETKAEEVTKVFSAHLAPTSVDDEARKRADRAKRFGLDMESEEMKKAQRAEKFGLDSNEISRGLDAALPERGPKRGRGQGGESERPAKRATPDRRGVPSARGRHGGGRRGDRGSLRDNNYRGGGNRREGGIRRGVGNFLNDPSEKAKAEARAKRFAA